MMATRPTPARISVPKDLAELPRWGVWRMEGTKVPYQVSGRRADSTDRSHWGELEHAQRAFATGRYFGLAFAFFLEDGLVGVDLDDCLSAGDLKPWAHGIVERFSDTYMEISPSGRGIKIWARGKLPANLPGADIQGGGSVELYSEKRYFAFTGRAFRGAPPQVEDHAADLLALYNGLTAGKKKWTLQPLEGGRIPYGQQHSTLVSIAGTLRARRICDEAIEACLQAVNRLQCERPSSPENIRRIVASSRKWGAM